MAHFPDTPSFTGFNTPSRIEADIVNLAHQGTIPPELDGAFYRVQPDPQFPPRLGDDIAEMVQNGFETNAGLNRIRRTKPRSMRNREVVLNRSTSRRYSCRNS